VPSSDGVCAAAAALIPSDNPTTTRPILFALRLMALGAPFSMPATAADGSLGGGAAD